MLILGRISDLCEETSLADALSHLKRYSKGAASLLYGEMLLSLQAGQQATEALQGWLDPHIVKGLLIAEKEGVLSEALSKTIEYLESQQNVLLPVMKGLLYPTIILLAAVGIATGIFRNFANTLNQTNVDISTLDGSFTVLRYVSNFAMYGSLPMLALFAAAAFYVSKYLRYSNDPIRTAVLDSQPIFREYRMILVNRLLNTFCLLIDQGVKEVQAIQLIRGDERQTYFAKHLISMEGRIKSGPPY